MGWSSDWGNREPALLSSEEQHELRSLTVMNDKKQYTFTAEIVGDLALDYEADKGWNIYHVPTLARFSKAVPSYAKPTEDQSLSYTKNEIICEQSYEYSREELLAWMKKVQEPSNYAAGNSWLIVQGWKELRALTPTDYETKGQSAKDIILNWCLSVPVEG